MPGLLTEMLLHDLGLIVPKQFWIQIELDPERVGAARRSRRGEPGPGGGALRLSRAAVRRAGRTALSAAERSASSRGGSKRPSTSLGAAVLHPGVYPGK